MIAGCSDPAAFQHAACPAAPPQGAYHNAPLVCPQGSAPRCPVGGWPSCMDDDTGGDIPHDAGPPSVGTAGCWTLNYPYRRIGPAHCVAD